MDCAAEVMCAPGKRPALVLGAEGNDVDAGERAWAFGDDDDILLDEVAEAEAVLVSSADGWLGTRILWNFDHNKHV